METAHLQEYVVLANRRSFTEAARELHLTQSTLSKHVASLEREFGTELFVRDRSGIKLTEAGVTLYNQALQINRLLQQTHHLLRSAKHDAPSDAAPFAVEPRNNTDLRCKCVRLAQQQGLTKEETGALILFLEERGFGAIQRELALSRDEVAEVLGRVYRKLRVSDKQAALTLVHSVSE